MEKTNFINSLTDRKMTMKSFVAVAEDFLKARKALLGTFQEKRLI